MNILGVSGAVGHAASAVFLLMASWLQLPKKNVSCVTNMPGGNSRGCRVATALNMFYDSDLDI